MVRQMQTEIRRLQRAIRNPATPYEEKVECMNMINVTRGTLEQLEQAAQLRKLAEQVDRKELCRMLGLPEEDSASEEEESLEDAQPETTSQKENVPPQNDLAKLRAERERPAFAHPDELGVLGDITNLAKRARLI